MEENKQKRITIDHLGECRTVTRRQAALEQILQAIRLFEEKCFASAITLALAAESQMPATDESFLFAMLKRDAPHHVDDFNEVRNWLKHPKSPEQMNLYEFEVFIAIARATTKYDAVYGPPGDEFTSFEEWARSKGYTRRR